MNKKRTERWQTGAAIINVARLIWSSGVQLRGLLNIEEPLEAVPTMAESLAKAEALSAQLHSELKGVQGELALLQNAHRMALSRLGEKTAERKAAVAKVRKEASERHKAAIKLRAADFRERLKRDRQAAQEAARVQAEGAAATKLAKARARARAVESSAKLSGKRLRRAQKAEAKADALLAELDALMEDQEQEEQPDSPSNSQAAKLQRRGDSGRFQAEPWQMRVLKWAQLGRRVPPSAINANITEVLTVYASHAVCPQPCERQMRKLRGELTIAGEMIAALRVALCVRIISFGFDESTKFGLGLLSTNTQIEPHDAPGTSVDVVMRGATLTAGGTAEHLSKEIEEKLFTHARRLLTLWRDEHERMYPGTWESSGMPSPDNIGMHRLSENAVLMSDTCNAARATKRLLAEMAESAGRERIGAEAWEQMSDEERQEKCMCHLGDCHDHMRNIIIKAMAAEATDFLQDKLDDSLAEFSSFDRMSVDCMDLIRAASKELHPNGEYAKGKGRESEATRKRDHPSDLWLPIFNAAGTRMDGTFDGAVPLYMNRVLILEFLHPLVHGPAAKDNMLEKFLWRVLSCTEMVALTRVCTLWQTLLTEPLRWLTGKASKTLDNWSMVDSNELLDKTYDLMVAVAADGSALLDPTLDPFAGLAEKQPNFADHRRKQQLQTIKAPDGTLHLSHVQTLQEARSPASAGGKESTPVTVELAQRMASAALVAMRDQKRAIADKLSSQDGANAANAANAARVRKATKGAHVMNAHVETNFGAADNCMRTYRNMTAENMSGMVQQGRNHDFDMPLNVASDRRKRKAGAEAPV